MIGLKKEEKTKEIEVSTRSNFFWKSSKIWLSMILFGIVVIGCQQSIIQTAPLKTEFLDLPFIVNYVDELGDNEVQLNWKELVAVLGVETKNEVHTITEQQLDDVSALFWDGKELKPFDEVVEDLDWSKQEKRKATRYLEELTYVGYVPQRLLPEAPETQFINRLIEPAKQNYKESGILPSITIAQAILESNWGKSTLTQEANNLFGIKLGVGWEGESHQSKTLEYHDVWIEDEFRKYESWQDSIDDHADFLIQNPRYQKAGIFEAKTYRTQAQALQEAGYSTAQDEEGHFVYAQRLGELIRQYNLQLIDHEVYLEKQMKR